MTEQPRSTDAVQEDAARPAGPAGGSVCGVTWQALAAAADPAATALVQRASTDAALWPEIVAAARAADPETRYATVGLLARLPSTEAVVTLLTALAIDPSWGVRSASMHALLAHSGASAAARAALARAAMTDPDNGVRSEALAALAEAPLDDAIREALVSLITREPDQALRMTAVGAAFRHRGDPAIRDALQGTLLRATSQEELAGLTRCVHGDRDLEMVALAMSVALHKDTPRGTITLARLPDDDQDAGEPQ